jgi:hypothetical protein
VKVGVHVGGSSTMLVSSVGVAGLSAPMGLISGLKYKSA